MKRVRTAAVAGLLACLAMVACKPAPRFVAIMATTDGRFTKAQYFNEGECGGQNMSPQIVWSGAPAATRSYAVTLFDPDAHPGGGRDGWWHWVVIDIPLNVHQLATGAGSGAVPLPLGARQTVSDFGTTTYGGPCPPAGEDHRYIATVYALKVDKLDLPGNLPPAEVKAQLDAHMLASVQVEARAAR